MPNTSSAKKRLLQSERSRVRNVSARSRMKTATKKAVSAVESSDAAATEAALRQAFRQIDRAAAKGVIHANQASRRKSRLALRRNRADAAK